MRIANPVAVREAIGKMWDQPNPRVAQVASATWVYKRHLFQQSINEKTDHSKAQSCVADDANRSIGYSQSTGKKAALRRTCPE